MTYIRYAFLGIVIVLTVTVALANREMVTLTLWPGALAALIGTSPSLRLPLFVVVVVSLGLGMVLGLIWEWLRERAIRREAVDLKRQLEKVEQALRQNSAESLPQATAAAPALAAQDDILALVESRPASR